MKKEYKYKRATILAFSLLVILVLFVILGSFFLSTMSENKITRSHLNLARAFWAAEAGVADVIRYLQNRTSTLSSNPNIYYNATIDSSETIGNTTYYNVTSTGYVVLPSGETFSRQLKVIVNADDVSANNFAYALESTREIDITGNAAIITGDNNCTNCTGQGCSCTGNQCCRENSTPSFTQLFGIDQETMRQIAIESGRYYSPSNFTSPVHNITWVVGNLSRSGSAGLQGDGILIIEGNANFQGNVNFTGILYVMGDLNLKGGGGGDPTFSGSIISDTQANVTTDLYGRVNLERNQTYIDNALNHTRPFVDKGITAWWQAW